MRLFITFITAFLIFFGGYALFNMYEQSQSTIQSVSNFSLTPTSIPFSILPAPKKTLTGNIESMEGDIKWVSRIARDEIKLTEPIPIQQGERIKTEEESNLVILFPDAVSITMSSESQLDFAQTLPANIVIEQSTGTATYTRLASIPITVRSGRLLIDLKNKSEMTVMVTSDGIQITAEQGDIELAYNDQDFVSQRVIIVEGDTRTFDYGTITVN